LDDSQQTRRPSCAIVIEQLAEAEGDLMDEPKMTVAAENEHDFVVEFFEAAEAAERRAEELARQEGGVRDHRMMGNLAIMCSEFLPGVDEL
jgi:hypothetical protein